jgi:hypothetical protein
MLKYIKNCYSYLCEILSNKFETLYRVNKNRLEQENQHYCRMTDGGFVIKKAEEPTVKFEPTARTAVVGPPTTPSLRQSSFYFRGQRGRP